MSSWKLVLSGIAAVSFVVLLQPGVSSAACLSERDGSRASGPLLEPIIFHGHSRNGISYYCYPRNYWWFYRPYTTAGEDYARCMPYFHYPPQAYRGGGGGAQMK
jgi:hypothetical protein